MKSTVFFTTQDGGFYLYDSINKYLLNSNQLIEQLSIINPANISEAKDLLKKTNPELLDQDIDHNYRKYSFLKSKGFFSEINADSLLTGVVTSEAIENNISNLGNIVFQVTNHCNFNCKYCCYGELYNGLPVENKKMNFNIAKRVLDYIVPYWKSRRNSSYKSTVCIGFYGGEPLLNINLIKQIISYCSEIESTCNTYFTYNMTTNAMLLPKHINYLIDHDFDILISLDGNENHNNYRVDKSGNSTFKKVFENVKHIKDNYPEYFKNKIQFNSVLTNKSSVSEIHEFIQSNFQKTPLIDPVSNTDTKETKLDSFNSIKNKYYESDDDINKRGIQSSIGKIASKFFYFNLNNSYRHYVDLLTTIDNTYFKRTPTGTCLPFGNKLYVTATGNIMTCERIAMQHIIGSVNNKEILLDFNEMANKYNLYLDGLRSTCRNCYMGNTCPLCIFQAKFIEGKPKCPHQITENDYKYYISHIVSTLERDHSLFFMFNKIMFS